MVLKTNQVHILTLPRGLLRRSQRTMVEFTRLTAAGKKLLLQDRCIQDRRQRDVEIALRKGTYDSRSRLLPQIRPWDAEEEIEVM